MERASKNNYSVIRSATVIKFIIALIRNIVWIPYYILDLIHRYIQYIIFYFNKRYILNEWTRKAGLIHWIIFNIRMTFTIWKNNIIQVFLRHLKTMRKEGYMFIQVYLQILFYAFIFFFLGYILINIYMFGKI